jgi:hypothetical protein
MLFKNKATLDSQSIFQKNIFWTFISQTLAAWIFQKVKSEKIWEPKNVTKLAPSKKHINFN